MAKRPRDPVQLAKQVFDIAIGEAEDSVSESKRHPSNRRVGGLKGGKARAKALSAAQRRKIARLGPSIVCANGRRLAEYRD
ncbi:MAG: histone H1 [Acidobacteria bacterium]|nr:MAG: histone H1 [Acidobacteriota bacterium]